MSAIIAELSEVEAAISGSEWEVLDALLRGFVEFSAGDVQVPAPAHMSFATIAGCPGDACIKAGGVRGSGRWWVTKVASSFYKNGEYGLQTSQGVMLVWSESTGELEAVLMDRGYLTNHRTALTAGLCVREFGPARAEGAPPLTIALFGTGTIAKLVAQQLRALHIAPAGSKLVVVSRSVDAARAFLHVQAAAGWDVVEALEARAAAAYAQEHADVIITCTPSEQPLFARCKRGALVVALGADAADKRELGADVFSPQDAEHAILVLADSRAQCLDHGELAHAIREGSVPDSDLVVELGEVLGNDSSTRAHCDQTVVIDLTGVAVQDIVIAGMALDAVRELRHAYASGPHAADVPAAPALGAAVPPPAHLRGRRAPSRADDEPPQDAIAQAHVGQGERNGGASADEPSEPAAAKTTAASGAARGRAALHGDAGAPLGFPAHVPALGATRAKRSATGAAAAVAAMLPSAMAAGPAVKRRAAGDGGSGSTSVAPSKGEGAWACEEKQEGADLEPPEQRPWPAERVHASLNRRVRVFWEGEEEWFSGVISHVSREGDWVHVKYDDNLTEKYANHEMPTRKLRWYENKIQWEGEHAA
ncbi:hypothetical protein KFE25_006858 [Diacronema lutheri]|uniref:Ornithine cyclodeaminase n=2 Tax=Diacronema lutheri TaxID=2081491 RepID=A0A8J5XRN9_DIALT|nr:hypothetical protein KFE25_006858 [Diacronema lutheri]